MFYFPYSVSKGTLTHLPDTLTKKLIPEAPGKGHLTQYTWHAHLVIAYNAEPLNLL